jgi:hypothetical protein
MIGNLISIRIFVIITVLIALGPVAETMPQEGLLSDKMGGWAGFAVSAPHFSNPLIPGASDEFPRG